MKSDFPLGDFVIAATAQSAVTAQALLSNGHCPAMETPSSKTFIYLCASATPFLSAHLSLVLLCIVTSPSPAFSLCSSYSSLIPLFAISFFKVSFFLTVLFHQCQTSQVAADAARLLQRWGKFSSPGFLTPWICSPTPHMHAHLAPGRSVSLLILDTFIAVRY